MDTRGDEAYLLTSGGLGRPSLTISILSVLTESLSWLSANNGLTIHPTAPVFDSGKAWGNVVQQCTYTFRYCYNLNGHGCWSKSDCVCGEGGGDYNKGSLDYPSVILGSDPR